MRKEAESAFAEQLPQIQTTTYPSDTLDHETTFTSTLESDSLHFHSRELDFFTFDSPITIQMRAIQAPCKNCLRFHYGVCREPPKQCFKCGEFNHIVRYCPHRQRVRVNSYEPLLGTRAWCIKHGLDKNPDLKHKILDTIKSSPGCAIWLDGVCIHSGNQSHFSSAYMSRGRPFVGHSVRRRSRSPLRNRSQRRSPSPLRKGRPSKTDLFGYDITPPRERDASAYQRRMYRSRSPLRRQSSPNRLPDLRPRSPRYFKDSDAVVYDAEDNSPTHIRQTASPRQPQSPRGSRCLTGPLFSFQPDISIPLRNVTNTSNAPGKEEEGRSMALLVPIGTKDHTRDSSVSMHVDTPAVEEYRVDNAHFILGVTEGAGEQE